MIRDEVIAANRLPYYLTSHGYDLRPARKKFVTNACPAADHKKYHRCVTIDTQKNLWHCNDCKRGGTVIDWVMIEKNVTAADAMRMLADGRNGSEAKRVLAKTYNYTDESGKLLFQTCRYRPKHFKQRRPDGKGGWIWDLEGTRRVLYRLPEVVKAQIICVAEGEKDCDKLTSLGFVATCNPMGAGKWRDEYSQAVRGKDVIVFGDVGDDDGAGERHTAQVIQALFGKANSIKHVNLPDGFHDVSDYIDSLSPETATDIIGKLIEQTPELSSLNSVISSAPSTYKGKLVDDFPVPLSEIAFHGLAGDIVRRIEPHTEADRAALLVQILIVFGNVIGRGAWTIADSSRHGTNLFAVLVGETSKARKGTSLAHVLRIFGRADEAWKQNCNASGLSSGEGLIWAVRDATGKDDPGIDDKRLTVTEGEFANVLKVMPREGNTLSSVIRSAWDSGDLRTLTKNSPARATDAHISIIGHITRDELRRFLTETEQGNGFGNRFLWLAVKRSKCLPEGGKIESENLNDLVKRLHHAVKFGRAAGEISRDEEARELWAIVYPQLSDGRPGLFGAITARAEAQVLRLSCIYALLDCSNKISSAHHRAALALWNYCDRSAQWIFSTSTGDPRADKILFALRIAGATGMTKTEISERVFYRNVSSDALSDALRILHKSGHAKFVKEITSGAPCERWIAVSKRTNLTK
jgi:hypothetical protein